jgi:hypothetical protein
MFYATSTLSVYEGLMIERFANAGFWRSATVALPLLLGCGLLGGCAGVGDSFASSAFVDPAKYDLYECKQLETERKTLSARTAELQGLMAKAETGVAGSVVSEVAYRNDYISARASANLAEEVWRKNKCVATPPSAAATVAPVPAPLANTKGSGVRSRSGSAIY